MTYIIGHYNPSVRIIELVSHTTYVVCANFIHKWRDLQFKVDSERQIFWEIFQGNCIYLLILHRDCNNLLFETVGFRLCRAPSPSFSLSTPPGYQKCMCDLTFSSRNSTYFLLINSAYFIWIPYFSTVNSWQSFDVFVESFIIRNSFQISPRALHWIKFTKLRFPTRQCLSWPFFRLLSSFIHF